MATKKADHTKKDPQVMPCTCKHDFQDSRYGAGNRLFNPCASATGKTYHCTVCGAPKEGK